MLNRRVVVAASGAASLLAGLVLVAMAIHGNWLVVGIGAVLAIGGVCTVVGIVLLPSVGWFGDGSRFLNAQLLRSVGRGVAPAPRHKRPRLTRGPTKRR